MKAKINQEVSAVMYYNARQRRPVLYAISWQNKEYKIGKIGYHHTVRQGDILHHIYECVDVDKTMWFRLSFDTSNLHWTLEATHDGLAS
jgi:hypothetical protein